MCYPGSVEETSHDLTAVVDPLGKGILSPGDIDGGEVPACIHEALCRRPKISHDLLSTVKNGARIGGEGRRQWHQWEDPLAETRYVLYKRL